MLRITVRSSCASPRCAVQQQQPQPQPVPASPRPQPAPLLASCRRKLAAPCACGWPRTCPAPQPASSPAWPAPALGPGCPAGEEDTGELRYSFVAQEARQWRQCGCGICSMMQPDLTAPCRSSSATPAETDCDCGMIMYSWRKPVQHAQAAASSAMPRHLTVRSWHAVRGATGRTA